MNGKLQPQAKEIEEAILGAILLERDAYDEVSEMITADCFYVNAHQSIYNAMKSLSAKHQPIDLHTVENELKIAGELEIAGGSYALIKLPY